MNNPHDIGSDFEGAQTFTSPAVRSTEPPESSRWVVRVILYGVIAACLLGIYLEGPTEINGVISIVLMLAFAALGVPIAIAMGVGGLLGILGTSDWSGVESTMRTVPWRMVASWPLSVLPMFVLMGFVLWRSGATDRVYEAAKQWVGWLPGGLAVTTNFAGAGLAALSGSTMGITYALARIGVPEMLKAGYDRRLATGSVLMAGTGGQLIPPSVLSVVYAGVAGTAVGPQLMAGVVPGVILVTGFGILIVGIAAFIPRFAPKPAIVSADISGAARWKLRWISAYRVWPLPLLLLVVLGGLYQGVFTATEAGAYGALGATIILVGYQGVARAFPLLTKSLLDTVVATSAIMFILVGAGLLSRSLTLSGVTTALVRWIEQLGIGRLGLLILLVVLYLILGMFMDPVTMILLTVPIIMPLLGPLDISLLWFGAFVVLLGELSMITPPIGILIFVLHKVVQDEDMQKEAKISLGDVFMSALWFLPWGVLVLLLMIFYPDVVEWLPNQMR